MKYPRFITIDPGSSNGGISFYRAGEPVQVMRMPSNDEIEKLKDYFKYIKTTYPDAIAFIEKVQIFSSDQDDNPGKQYRIKVLLANYERIVALLILIGLPYVEVYPQSWQATLKLKTKGLSDKDRKNAFKKYASNCFPEVKVTLWSSDALCIAQAMLIKQSSTPLWIEERLKNNNSDLFS